MVVVSGGGGVGGEGGKGGTEETESICHQTKQFSHCQ